MVRDLLEDFPIYQQIRIHEHIQGMVDHPLGGIFDGNYPEIRAPSLVGLSA